MNLSSTFIAKPEEVLIKALLQVFKEDSGVVVSHNGILMLCYRLNDMIHAVAILDPDVKEGDIVSPPLKNLPGVLLH